MDQLKSNGFSTLASINAKSFDLDGTLCDPREEITAEAQRPCTEFLLY